MGTDGEESSTGATEWLFLIADASANNAAVFHRFYVNTGCQIDADHMCPFSGELPRRTYSKVGPAVVTPSPLGISINACA